ncbi:hypothetical protein ACLOJK_016537 [Asimina triloba]
MQRQSLLRQIPPFNVAGIPDGLLHDSKSLYALPGMWCLVSQNHNRNCVLKVEIPLILESVSLDKLKTRCSIHVSEYTSPADENQGGLSDSEEEDELCPVDCVREFKTDDELFKILEKAKETDSLVVVDFYRTSCGSCKYIEQGFAKLCRGSGDEDAPIIFLKHNVIDEYDEQSEVAERLRIRVTLRMLKAVPLFHFYKNGVLLEAFPTRDKEKIVAAIEKYSQPASRDL